MPNPATFAKWRTSGARRGRRSRCAEIADRRRPGERLRRRREVGADSECLAEVAAGPARDEPEDPLSDGAATPYEAVDDLARRAVAAHRDDELRAGLDASGRDARRRPAAGEAASKSPTRRGPPARLRRSGGRSGRRRSADYDEERLHAREDSRARRVCAATPARRGESPGPGRRRYGAVKRVSGARGREQPGGRRDRAGRYAGMHRRRAVDALAAPPGRGTSASGAGPRREPPARAPRRRRAEVRDDAVTGDRDAGRAERVAPGAPGARSARRPRAAARRSSASRAGRRRAARARAPAGEAPARSHPDSHSPHAMHAAAASPMARSSGRVGTSPSATYAARKRSSPRAALPGKPLQRVRDERAPGEVRRGRRALATG